MNWHNSNFQKAGDTSIVIETLENIVKEEYKKGWSFEWDGLTSVGEEDGVRGGNKS